MAWRSKLTAKSAPEGSDLALQILTKYDTRMKHVLSQPIDSKLKSELTWQTTKLNFQKNREFYNLEKRGAISSKLILYLFKHKLLDQGLYTKWNKKGYETLCSTMVINKKNTNFGTVGICRVPLAQRRGSIMPNVQSGCVSCATGDHGPIWWDDPVPQHVLDMIQAKKGIAEPEPEAHDEQGQDELDQEHGNVKRKAPNDVDEGHDKDQEAGADEDEDEDEDENENVSHPEQKKRKVEEENS